MKLVLSCPAQFVDGLLTADVAAGDHWLESSCGKFYTSEAV